MKTLSIVLFAVITFFYSPSETSCDLYEKDAIDFIEVHDILSEPFEHVSRKIYISNTHRSRPITVRYKLKGEYGATKHTKKVYANEWEYVYGYNSGYSKSVTILSAWFSD